MSHIFISYRRSDSKDVAGRVYDWLANAFGEPAIFKDTQNIVAGEDFRKSLARNIHSSRVMLVIIGETWLKEIHTRKGKGDFVYFEVMRGLQSDHVNVIPVLVNGASMPSENTLPNKLKALAYCNARTLRSEPEFRKDIKALVQEVGQIAKLQSAGVGGGTPRPAQAPIQQTGDFNFAGEVDARGANFTKNQTTFNTPIHPKIPALQDKDKVLSQQIQQLSQELEEAREIEFADQNVSDAVSRKVSPERAVAIVGVPLLVAGIAFNLINTPIPVAFSGTTYMVNNVMLAVVSGLIALSAILVLLPTSAQGKNAEASVEQASTKLQRQITTLTNQRQDIADTIEQLHEEWARQTQNR